MRIKRIHSMHSNCPKLNTKVNKQKEIQKRGIQNLKIIHNKYDNKYDLDIMMLKN